MMNCPRCGAQLKMKMELMMIEEPAPATPPPWSMSPQRTHPVQKESRMDDLNSIGALLRRIDDVTLADHELGFVQQMRQRFKQYGSSIKVSEKQISWLHRLASKYQAVS